MSTRISPTTEQALAGAVAGHRMAGMELSETELAVLRRQADGELTGDQARAELLASIRRP
ncbi:MAG TPA: antitoxin VbhA family protein [Candidatus Dietzia intestinipullorum]|nr:antitoxin VbhA family protein [Candidatus Dietzia intestinipullorum]